MLDNLTDDQVVADYYRRLADDYTFFVHQYWKAKGLHLKAPIGWMEEDVLHYTQYGPRRRVIYAPREMGKTMLVTVPYPLWRWFRDPEWTVAIVSKSNEAAKKFISETRNSMEMVPFLRPLIPEPHHIDNRNSFDVGGSGPSGKVPSCHAVGIDGQITGLRAHTIILDDIETINNVRTVDARQTLLDTCKEFNRVMYSGEGEIIDIGTYHAEESVHIALHQMGYDLRTWTLCTPTRENAKHIINLSPTIQAKLDSGELSYSKNEADYVNNSLFKHRALGSQEEIAIQLAADAREFAMQYMGIATLGDATRYPLRLRNFIVFDGINPNQAPVNIHWGTTDSHNRSTKIDMPCYGLLGDALLRQIGFTPEFKPYERVRMRIDPSGRGNDKTAWAVGGLLNGYIWVMQCKGMNGPETGYDREVLEAIAKDARKYRVHEIVVESNAGGEMLVPLLRPHLERLFLRPGESDEFPNGWGCTIEAVRSSGQKELRIIQSLGGTMANHRVVIERDVIADEALQRQITRITHDKNSLPHDDEVDALAALVGDFRERLGVDAEKAHERHLDDLAQKAIDERLARVGRSRPRKRAWQTRRGGW